MTNSADFIKLDHPKDCPCSDCEIKFEPPDHEEPPCLLNTYPPHRDSGESGMPSSGRKKI